MPATLLKPMAFRFDADDHTYWVNGVQVPHITGMLQKVGIIDSRYYTDRVRERGRAVHRLTAEYDLRALDVDRLVSPYRGYVLSHVAAVERLRPTWLAIEEPVVHPQYLFGCRPDRIAKVFKALTIVDEKSGAKEKWHAIQTALQAIGVAWRYGVDPWAIPRASLYVTQAGRFKYDPHPNRSDFDKAFEVIKTCC